MSGSRDAEYSEYVAARLSSLRRLSGTVGDSPAAAMDHDAALDLRAAVSTLPPGQRATLVLRFYCDLNVEQSAAILGCSAGTVKSQTARGLEAVRVALGPAHAGHPGRGQPDAAAHPTTRGGPGDA